MESSIAVFLKRRQACELPPTEVWAGLDGTRALARPGAVRLGCRRTVARVCEHTFRAAGRPAQATNTKSKFGLRGNAGVASPLNLPG